MPTIPTTRPPGTKIVATLGPASNSAEMIERLLQSGVTVVRLNFSHGTHAEHEQTVQTVRAVSERLGRPVAIMGDLCGPKIRLLEMQDGAQLDHGAKLSIVREPLVGNAQRVATNHPAIIDEVEVGHHVLIDDGMIRLRVAAKERDRLLCECEFGGQLGSRKGVNLPDTLLSTPALTPKDLEDADWSASVGLDYLALSFVRSAADVELLRRRLADRRADCHIIPKIETKHAVANLGAIIDAGDAVLVARGDLGVELDVATVPRVQKEITARCRATGKPVIVATQMLQSMVTSATPARSEVSDIANAVFDTVDALLLSAETAVGRFPIPAVEMLGHIAQETETYDPGYLRADPFDGVTRDVPTAVARGVCSIADEVNARAVVLWTDTGRLARLVSKHRLDRPVLAMTSSPAVQRRMALYYGVTPLLSGRPAHVDQHLEWVDGQLIKNGWAGAGDLIVVGFGPHSLGWGNTGAITIHAVGRRAKR